MFSNKEFLNFIEDSKSRALDLVVVSVIQTQGSTFAKEGNMILINSEEEFIGVLGSPALHKNILEISKEVLQTNKPNIFESIPTDKSSGHGKSKFLIQSFFYKDSYGALGVALENTSKTLVRSIVDNSYKIIDQKISTKLEENHFYQFIESPYSLLIFGSGAHVKPLISMANLMGWKTTVIDMKIKEYVSEADELIELESLDDIWKIDLDVFDASVILSHSPKTDDVYLKALLNSKLKYIGLMGNKHNIKRKKEQFHLLDEERFFAPVGLDIGTKTHQGIALSICAQIEAKRDK